MDNQQGPIVRHMGPCSVLCVSLDVRGLGEEWVHVCKAKSLCYSLETTTTLLISYTPIQNVFDVKKKMELAE